MAAQRPVLLVEDAPGAAVRAAAQPAALAALQHRRVAAPVEEDEALLAARDALVQRGDDLRRERRRRRAGAQADGGLGQPAHVDQADRRPGRAADPLGQGEAPIAAQLRALPGLERRRRRAEDDEDALAPAAPDRQVARRVARAFLLLVRGVVLLVDDDDAEPRQRREHREARAEDEVGQAELCRQPAAQPLRRRQPAVQGDDAPAGEAAREAVDQLRRQVDLGDQHEGLAPGRERQAGGAQVDLGLAAAGDAVEERRPGRFAFHRRGDRAGRLGLVAGQRRFWVGRRRGVLAGRRVRAVQAPDPVGDRVAAEPAQFGRQHGERDLADAALVVACRELDQRAPIGAQRRQRVADLGDLPQLVGNVVRGGR